MGLIEMLQKYAQCDTQQRISFDCVSEPPVPPSELPADITDWPEELQQKLKENTKVLEETFGMERQNAEASAMKGIIIEQRRGNDKNEHTNSNQKQRS